MKAPIQQKNRYVRLRIIVLLLAALATMTSCVINTNENEATMLNRIPGITIPDATEIGKISTANYDMAAAISKKLVVNSTALSKDYVYLQAVYRAAFNRWLDRGGLLTAFDGKLQHDPRDFTVLPIGKQSYEQKYASYGRQYLFILNSLFIERLSEADLQILKSAASLEDAALEELVARTYAEVIEVREQDGQPCNSVIYSSTVFGLWEAPSDAIVLEICYRWNFQSVDDSAIATLESQKERDLNRWRDDLVEQLYEQTKTKVFALIDNI